MTIRQPDRAFFRYVATGMANTVVGLALIHGARMAGLGEVPANATGYAIGFALSFSLNRRWTFRRRGPLRRHLFRFAAVMLLAWTVNLVVLLELMRRGIGGMPAQAGAVLAYVLTGYLGSRHWAFAPRPNRGEEG